MSKVAIIIPCYNLGEFLLETVDSALNQTYPDVEVIVVDDGSDEPGTLACLAELTNQPVKLTRTSNQGLAAARNHGIAQTNATFILPLDADDLIDPTLVAKAVEIMDTNPAIGIVSCEAEFFGIVTGPWQLPPLHFPDMLLTPALFATALFRRTDWETVAGYKSDMVYGYEDHEFWLSLLELGRKPHRISETLFQYRQRPGSMSAQIDPQRKKHSFQKCLQHHPRLFTDNFAFLLGQFVEQNEAQRRAQQSPSCQIFFSCPGEFNEEWSIRSSYPSGKPVRLEWETRPLPKNNAAQIRLDPGDRPGVYRIHSLEIRSAVDDDLILEAKSEALKTLVVDIGDGLILPNSDAVTFLSHGQDPRLLLQDSRLIGTDVPWKIAIIIQFDPRLEAAREELSALSGLSSHFPRLI